MLKLNICQLPNEFNTRGTKLIEISIWKYRLIATLRKLDVLETNISPRSESFEGKYDSFKTDFSKRESKSGTIKSTFPRHKHSIVYIVQH